MENWIKVSLLSTLGAGILMPYILVPLGLSSLAIGSITILLEVAGVVAINHIINIKDKKQRNKIPKNETQAYLEEIENKTQYIKDTENRKIITKELIPVDEPITTNFLYNDYASIVNAYLIDEKLQSLQEELATSHDKKETQRIQNETTIYKFMLQDIREESGKSLNKVLKR